MEYYLTGIGNLISYSKSEADVTILHSKSRKQRGLSIKVAVEVSDSLSQTSIKLVKFVESNHFKTQGID